MSRISPVTETLRIKIEHPSRPAEADYEYSDLIRRIETMGGERVVVAILQQYAFAAPSHGSYAGSLWAIAEWLNERLSAGHAQCPDQWRSIETAPSDGSRIYVYGGRWVPAQVSAADGEWWRRMASEGNSMVPTHWQPLPAPPASPDTSTLGKSQ